MPIERFTPRSRGAEKRREALREIREELERMRRAEAKVAEALGSARASRQRVEELVQSVGLEDESVRNIVREELRAAGDDRTQSPTAAEETSDRGGVTGLFAAPPARSDGGAAEASTNAPEPEKVVDEEDVEAAAPGGRPFWLLGVAAVSLLVVAAVGWLGVQAFTGSDDPPTLMVGGDSTSPLSGPVAAANGVLDTAPKLEAESEVVRDSVETAEFFALLPDSAGQRAAVYDSLWQAHSPIFDPLFARIESSTSETTVKRALGAWHNGSLTALQKDLLHSALVQYALREEMGADIAVDGQLLRNPCRGASCSALLNFWEARGQGFGLPPVPEDAPRNTQALRTAESVLVLKTLEDVNRSRETNGG
jgi:hypothetical protein